MKAMSVKSLSHRFITRVRLFSAFSNDNEQLKQVMNYLDNLKNFEKSGVPKGAGTDSDDGFDLGRMRNLMEHLGNPHSTFKSVHIAGTKGKGSTAAFLSNILRAQGYSVGSYTSPHIHTIRERITIGKLGQPVTPTVLNTLFRKIKHVLENAHVTHFEALTGIAFTLFSQENVDIAVIEAGLGGARDATNVITPSGLAASVITTIGEEHLDALGGSLESIAMAKSGIIKKGRPVVLGGVFDPHIERILRDKALLMCSPVISPSGNKSRIKGITNLCGELRQSCDIVDGIELLDVNLRMIGYHQLLNAVTATCAALCLRDQGWGISDVSIRAGLENTYLLGRSQLLKSKEADALGLPGTTIMLDGAHTKDSARALSNTIRLAFPNTRLVLVVAMASDKDHVAFAKELLAMGQLEAVFLTEVSIAGDKSRTTSSTVLKDRWIQASRQLGTDIIDHGVSEYHDLKNQSGGKIVLAAENSYIASMRAGHQILQAQTGDQLGIIVVTGSLHIVSSVLGSLQ